VGSLLDIGAGIGALTLELIEKGVTHAVAVDASPAYIAAASEEAGRRGRTNAIKFVRGDFVEFAPEIPAARIVTLDRVICCYPAYAPLLRESLRHAERFIAFSYPKNVWYVRFGNTLINAKRRFTGNTFRTFIHNTDQIQRVVREGGFNRVTRKSTPMWIVDVCERLTDQPIPPAT
jgi:magnesium-protoporphyrin O-methyltransferase